MVSEKAVENLIQPVARTRLRDQIVEQLNSLIAEGLLKPGDRLPPERDLAERFKVSRNSVRDALRSLEAKGLLEMRQGDGTYIREADASAVYDDLIDILVTRKETIREIMQVRQIIEPGIAYVAAKNAQPEDLAKLKKLLERHEQKAAVEDPGVEEDSLFHFTIAQMTGNEFLVRLLSFINSSIEETRDMLLRYTDTESVRIGHRRILKALERKDPEGARQAMLMHIEEVTAAYEVLESEEQSMVPELGDFPHLHHKPAKR